MILGQLRLHKILIFSNFKPDDFLEHTKCSEYLPYKKAKRSETTRPGGDATLLGAPQDGASKD